MSGVPMNDLATMKNCPVGWGGGLGKVDQISFQGKSILEIISLSSPKMEKIQY